MEGRAVSPSVITCVECYGQYLFLAKGNMVERRIVGSYALEGVIEVDGEVYRLLGIKSGILIFTSSCLWHLDSQSLTTQRIVDNKPRCLLWSAVQLGERIIVASRNGYIHACPTEDMDSWTIQFDGLVIDFQIASENSIFMLIQIYSTDHASFVELDSCSGVIRSEQIAEDPFPSWSENCKGGAFSYERLHQNQWRLRFGLSNSHLIVSRGKSIIYGFIADSNCLVLFDNGDVFQLFGDARGAKLLATIRFPSQPFAVTSDHQTLFVALANGSLLVVPYTSAAPISSHVFQVGGSVINGIHAYSQFDKSALVLKDESLGAGLFKLRHGIRVDTVCRSEPCFKLATGLWSLREHRSDDLCRYLLISFPCSTHMFCVNGDDVAHVSEVFPVETRLSTLCAANSKAGNYIIQVCSRGIFAFKSIMNNNSINHELVSWFPHSEESRFSKALILDNFVYAFDATSHSILILQFRPSLPSDPTGRFAFQSSIHVGEEISALDVSPCESDCSSVFLSVSLVNSPSIILYQVRSDGSSCMVDVLYSGVLETGPEDFSINSISFIEYDSRIAALFVGSRQGSILSLKFDALEKSLVILQRIHNFSQMPIEFKKYESRLFAISDGLWLVNPGRFSFQRMMNHVEFMAPITLMKEKSSNPHRLAILKGGVLTLTESRLTWSSWLEPWIELLDPKCFCMSESEEFVIAACETLEIYDSLSGERRFKSDLTIDRDVGICGIAREGQFITWEKGCTAPRVTLWRYNINPTRSQRRKSLPNRVISGPIQLISEVNIQGRIVSVSHLGGGYISVITVDEIVVLFSPFENEKGALDIVAIEQIRGQVISSATDPTASVLIISTIYDGCIYVRPLIRPLVSVKNLRNGVYGLDMQGNIHRVWPFCEAAESSIVVHTKCPSFPKDFDVGRSSHRGDPVFLVAQYDGSIYEYTMI